MEITSHEQSKAGQKIYDTREGFKGFRTEYIGFPAQPGRAQAWMLDSSPGRVLQAHYHEVDQFQVIFSGDGLMGKHRAGPGYVHFSRAHTPYGPVVWGEKGMDLLTIRPRPDSEGGPKFMPESKDRLRQTPRTPFQIGMVVNFPEAKGEVTIEALPGIKDDAGLAADAITLKPGAQTLAPDPSKGGGQWILVMKGSIVHEGKTFPAFSVAEVRPEDPAMLLKAGSEGAHVLCLGFSRASAQGAQAQARPMQAAATRTWLCELCGFVYDEAEGMPEEGIAPGTRWEDVPETFGCPDCSAVKADFKMVEI
jgi:rubredoxin